MKKLLIALGLCALCAGFAFTGPPVKKQEPAFLSVQSKWVDSVFNSLTPEQRLGQLFMVAVYSNKDLKHVKEIKELITKYNIGGLIWMQGGPLRQGALANYFQSVATTPLLYGVDGEWGLAMRLDSTPRYPKQMTLGAIQNDSLIYKMGRQIAQECKRLGIHVNFAPVADVNNNPLNPVIGVRSFGENKFKVAKKAAMYMQGLQDERVMASGKHFPGHGDTDSDSHKTLPYLTHSRERLDSLELYPFRYLFERGLSSIMVAHLNVPALDTTKNLPSTLSPLIVNDLLKNKLGFKGLVFTDALNMKGVANSAAPGLVDAKALLAGNDVLLFSEDVPKAITEIKKAIDEKKISQQEIDERCKKILRAKYWCGLNAKQQVVTRNLYNDLNSAKSEAMNTTLAEAAVTLLKNDKHFLPLHITDTLRIVEVSFGVQEENTLYTTLNRLVKAEHVGLSHTATPAEIDSAFKKINKAHVLVLQVNKATLKADNNYGIGAQTIRLLDSLSTLKPSILVMMSSPYLLNKLPSVSNYKAIIMAYEYMPSLMKASANVMLGLSPGTNGKLPVSTVYFKEGSGIDLPGGSAQKLKALRDELQKKKFASVDSIALAGIADKAYPGCEIVAMKDGEVVYQRSFGAYTYNSDAKKVSDGTIYDLASVTKVAATSLALMKLASEGKFDYTKTLGYYLPELKGSNKDSLKIEDVLSHQAGLPAWIPFYLRTLNKKGGYKKEIYSKAKSKEYPVQVADHLYIISSYRDSIYQRIINSKLETPGKYVYSDLGYYFMQRIIERQSKQTLDTYVKDLYAKMGLSLTFLPLNYFSKIQIAPTEDDKTFRKQVVQGYVHDPGAAMQGGVAGHAGLFGTALDLAKLMQMYMNYGTLNGVRILDEKVVREFTGCHFCPGNRRGLCFDKPEPDPKRESPVTSECSSRSFGHSGFTGTFVWADPDNELIFVFLSNRVYPDAEPNKLAKSGIRGKIHKAFYEAMK